MYFNHLFNLDDWNINARYIIFDDIDFKFLPARKAFWGSQKQFVVSDKYRKKQTITWGKPMIYLCNIEPSFEDSERDWYMSNCIIVNIYEPLF